VYLLVEVMASKRSPPCKGNSRLSSMLTDGPWGCPQSGLSNHKGNEEWARIFGFLKAFPCHCLSRSRLDGFSLHHERLTVRKGAGWGFYCSGHLPTLSHAPCTGWGDGAGYPG
jgi:hypothetical protein